MTTKLSDLQLILLTTAAQRSDGSLLPSPDSVPGHRGRIGKSVASLIERGLANELDVADPALSWRSEGDQLIGAAITNQGREAIGVEVIGDVVTGTHSNQPVPSGPASPREGSKQALVISLLEQPGGVALADLVAATGWLPHTTRAALTGLRKRGHAIVAEKTSGTMRYSIATAA